MTTSAASIRDALLEMLAAVGGPPYRSARLLRAVERAHRALAPKGLCENCDDHTRIFGRVGLDTLVEFRYDLQLYLCDSCHAFHKHEMSYG